MSHESKMSSVEALLQSHLQSADSILLIFSKECGYKFLRIYSKLTTHSSVVFKDVEPYLIDPSLYTDSNRTQKVDLTLMLRDVIKDLTPCTKHPEPVVYRFYIQ